MNELQARIEALEKTNRWWSRAAVTLLMIGLVAICSGQAKRESGNKFGNLFVTDQLIVGKADGGPVVAIRGGTDGASINILTGKNEPHVHLSFDSKSGIVFGLESQSGGMATIVISEDKKQETKLTLSAPKTKGVGALLACRPDGVAFSVSSPDGTHNGIIGATNERITSTIPASK